MSSTLACAVDTKTSASHHLLYTHEGYVFSSSFSFGCLLCQRGLFRVSPQVNVVCMITSIGPESNPSRI